MIIDFFWGLGFRVYSFFVFFFWGGGVDFGIRV